MSQSQQRQNKTRSEQFEDQNTYSQRYGKKETDEGLSFGVRFLLSFLSLAPCVCLFFYAVGWWQVNVVGLDSWDNAMTSFAVMCGIINLLIINLFLRKRWG